MYFCYLDESGTPELGAQTSHFILLGVAIPAIEWHTKDRKIDLIKAQFGLKDMEVHTGFLARRFPEQEKIPDFSKLAPANRRLAVIKEREAALIRIAALKDTTKLKAQKKLYAKTKDYIHLDFGERTKLLQTLASEVGSWNDTWLFADAQDKTKSKPDTDVFEIAFSQVVARFHTFLERQERALGRRAPGTSDCRNYGLLIEDNNETNAARLTALMRRFHAKGGTWWTKINRIIETPLFVDSSLTSMIQIADLCAYATRRFFENGETDLFDRIFPRFDRALDLKKNERVVGIRHYTGTAACACAVCKAHGR